MTIMQWFISSVAAALILIPLQNAQAWDQRSNGSRYGGQHDSQRNYGDSGSYGQGYRGYEGRGYSGNHGYEGHHGDYRHHGDDGHHYGNYSSNSSRRPLDQPER